MSIFCITLENSALIYKYLLYYIGSQGHIYWVNKGFPVVGLKLFFLAIVRHPGQFSKVTLKIIYNQHIRYSFCFYSLGGSGEEGQRRRRKAYIQLNSKSYQILNNKNSCLSHWNLSSDFFQKTLPTVPTSCATFKE